MSGSQNNPDLGGSTVCTKVYVFSSSVMLISDTPLVPGSPTHLILTDINSISIKATWSLPSRFNSQITGYCLVLTQLSTPYSVELLAVCKNYSELKHTFSSLDANTVYSVSIAAKNDNGLGLELENRVTLNPGPPSLLTSKYS